LLAWTEQTLPFIQDQLESIKRIAIAMGVLEFRRWASVRFRNIEFLSILFQASALL